MADHKTIPVVSIVGRPNVGKSSLFNVLVGERKAVVVEESGTTRDRNETVMSLGGKRMKLIDTGGYMPEDKHALAGKVKAQIHHAMKEADALIFVVDASAGITPLDSEVAALLRKYNKKVILAANKSDNQKREAAAVEFYGLGFGEPVAVSCLHMLGIDDLEDRIRSSFEDTAQEEEKETDEKAIKIAIVGRPNVGKSSFVNCLLNEERVIVSEIPGTTRDSIDTLFIFNGEEYILIDTAGIRHDRKIRTAVDTFSVMRSKESIERADVAILMIDAADGMTRDNMDILNFIEENGKACIIAVNKWDLAETVEGVTKDDYEEKLMRAVNKSGFYPIFFISAKTGKNVMKTVHLAKALNAALDTVTPTSVLNKLFDRNDPSDIPISGRKRRPNFFYITQTHRRPVEFTCFVNDPGAVLEVHTRYIENLLRNNLSLKGIPIRVKFRSSHKEKEKPRRRRR